LFLAGFISMHVSPFKRINLFIIVFTVLTATLSLGGCSSQPPQISVEGQYANMSGMFLGAGSVFMKIRNTGGRDALLGAAAELPNMVVELHDVKENRMVKIGKIPVPSHETVELKPRSLHIMLFNMPKTVQEGSTLTLTLTFEKSGALQVPVRFEKPQQMPMHGGH